MNFFNIIKNCTALFFASILLLYPLHAENSKNIILEAKGQGNTEKQAISNALDILSQQIYVSVENQTKSSEILKNDSFSSNMENTSVISSNGYFQNISIYNKKESKKNGSEVTVGLTSESISSTIDYLFLQLKEDQIYNLSKAKLREQLNTANFLLSLTFYAKANKVNYSKKSNNLSEYILKLNKILSADAVVKFLVYPENTASEISIEKNLYKPYENVYLSKGKYFYKVKTSGYKTIEDSIDVSKGDDLEVEIYLQKKLKAPLPIKLKVINKTNLDTNLITQSSKKLLAKNQMKESSNSENYIEFQLSEKTSASIIAGYDNNVIDVTIKTTINGIEKSEFFSINNLSKQNKKQTFEDNVIKQINNKSQMFFARLFD